MQRETERRFWRKVRLAGSGCWEWKGGLSPEGYARFSYDGRQGYAHRYVMGLPARSGRDLSQVVDHLCRNRGCVNPDHMEVVTHAENIRRGLATTWQPFCNRGHAQTGPKDCPVCNRERAREYYYTIVRAENTRPYRRKKA